MAHILLIEDDADFVEVTRMVLESNGHTMTAAYSAEEGWAALAKEPPNVILLDCMMEEFDSGFVLANDISIKYPDVPIIMLTAVHDYMSSNWNFSTDKDKDWLPVHQFLEKPVTPDALLAAIEKELHK
jgi:two-component system response regulator ChvI